jgi:hypothetical protein
MMVQNAAGWTSIPAITVLARPVGYLEDKIEAVEQTVYPEEREAGEEAFEDVSGEEDQRLSIQHLLQLAM